MTYTEEIKAIASRIRESDTWDLDDCRKLCDAAGMLDEFEASDGETFENVLFAAAKALGVEIV